MQLTAFAPTFASKYCKYAWQRCIGNALPEQLDVSDGEQVGAATLPWSRHALGAGAGGLGVGPGWGPIGTTWGGGLFVGWPAT
jgi:hypothetical protein